MNIYYYKKQHIDIPKFWREIGKMSVAPVILGGLTFVILQFVSLGSVFRLGAGILLFSAVYIPVFWLTSMNNYERDLLLKPVKRSITKISGLIKSKNILPLNQ